MKILLSSLFVDDQDKALKFYTEVLGFIKKTEFPAGEYKFLTVVSPELPDGAQLSLEPNGNPNARLYQQQIYKAGIQATGLFVDDLADECARLKQAGVRFHSEMTTNGVGDHAVIDDTCGNLIGLYQL